MKALAHTLHMSSIIVNRLGATVPLEFEIVDTVQQNKGPNTKPKKSMIIFVSYNLV